MRGRCRRGVHHVALKQHFLLRLFRTCSFIIEIFLKEYQSAPNNRKLCLPGHGYFSKLEDNWEDFEKDHCERGELYVEYLR